MDELKERQVIILKAIHKYKVENKISPTYRELNEIVGIESTSTMYSYIMKLRKDGLITSIEKIPRSIVLTAKGKTMIRDKTLEYM